jgi:hypothetical protein
MTTQDPKVRPSASQSLDQWRKIRRRISSIHKAWRLRSRDETWLDVLVHDMTFGAQCFRTLTGRRPVARTPYASLIGR